MHVGSLILAAGLISTSACLEQSACESDAACAAGSFCARGLCVTECVAPEDCASQPVSSYCSARGRCDAIPERRHTSGRDEMPGSGFAYVVDSIAIADKGSGFDLDGRCRAPGDCSENALWQFGWLGNDQLRQALLGAEWIYVLELFGVDDFVEDDEVTLAVYGAADADEPFFPANNFQTPRGHSTCCEFVISGRDAVERGGRMVPRNQIPGKIERRRFVSDGPSDVWVDDGLARLLSRTSTATGTESEGEQGQILLERVASALEVRATELSGAFGGAISVRSMAGTHGPTCEALNLCPQVDPNGTFADLLASFYHPDVDLDGDGLEAFETEAGRISKCFDGPLSCSGGADCVVPPIISTAARSCAFQPQMQDGFSVAFNVSAVRATIVGVSPRVGHRAPD
ncbi:MAG: hypothetical protein HY791_28820 [Deltaproteobacteria bacterium]|nr:hypothetical protein [Deltaproteobacteria bacterium]